MFNGDFGRGIISYRSNISIFEFKNVDLTTSEQFRLILLTLFTLPGAFRALTRLALLLLEDIFIQLDESRVKMPRHNVYTQVALILGRRIRADFDSDDIFNTSKRTR
jgi:hypothetical protein